MKAYVRSRPGGVGIGDSKGKGAQINLLLHQLPELQIADASVRWILCDATLDKGSPRYAFFTSTRAKNAVMGEVAREKQNNLRVGDFQKELVTWNELLQILHDFLIQ